MATILTQTDFIDKAKYYGIPALKFAPELLRLNSCIDFSQSKFIRMYNLTEAEISASNELKEALKYFTFAEWIRSEWLAKTPVGASVQKKQDRGIPKYDTTREIEARNMAIDIINEVFVDELEVPYTKLLPFKNY